MHQASLNGYNALITTERQRYLPGYMATLCCVSSASLYLLLDIYTTYRGTRRSEA